MERELIKWILEPAYIRVAKKINTIFAGFSNGMCGKKENWELDFNSIKPVLTQLIDAADSKEFLDNCYTFFLNSCSCLTERNFSHFIIITSVNNLPLFNKMVANIMLKNHVTMIEGGWQLIEKIKKQKFYTTEIKQEKIDKLLIGIHYSVLKYAELTQDLIVLPQKETHEMLTDEQISDYWQEALYQIEAFKKQKKEKIQRNKSKITKEVEQNINLAKLDHIHLDIIFECVLLHINHNQIDEAQILLGNYRRILDEDLSYEKKDQKKERLKILETRFFEGKVFENNKKQKKKNKKSVSENIQRESSPKELSESLKIEIESKEEPKLSCKEKTKLKKQVKKQAKELLKQDLNSVISVTEFIENEKNDESEWGKIEKVNTLTHQQEKKLQNKAIREISSQISEQVFDRLFDELTQMAIGQEVQLSLETETLCITDIADYSTISDDESLKNSINGENWQEISDNFECSFYNSVEMRETFSIVSNILKSINCEAYLMGGALYKTYRTSSSDLDILLPYIAYENQNEWLMWFAESFRKSLEQIENIKVTVELYKNKSGLLIFKVIINEVKVDFVMYADGINEHAQKTDCTVNAMYFGSIGKDSARLQTPFLMAWGNMPQKLHVKNRELHTVEKPYLSYRNDPSRIFRDIRNVAVQGFSLSEASKIAIQNLDSDGMHRVFSLKREDKTDFLLPGQFCAQLKLVFEVSHTAEIIKLFNMFELTSSLQTRIAELIAKHTPHSYIYKECRQYSQQLNNILKVIELEKKEACVKVCQPEPIVHFSNLTSHAFFAPINSNSSVLANGTKTVRNTSQTSNFSSSY